MEKETPKHTIETRKDDHDTSPAMEMVSVGTIAPDQTLIVPQFAEASTWETFPFLKLPPELREMIYQPLIQAGDLSILRVSKLVNHEAVPHLSKVGIFRMNLGRPVNSQVALVLTAKITLSGLLTLTAPDYIQQLDLFLDMSKYRCYFKGIKLIQCFAGNEVARKLCKVVIMFGPIAPIPDRLEDDQTYQGISAMIGFETLLLKLVYHRDFAHETLMQRRHRAVPLNGVYSRSHSMIMEDYNKVFEFLSLTLGPADICGDVDGHCLEFWPRSYQIQG